MLLVEDDQEIREYMKRFLEDLGYEGLLPTRKIRSI